MVIASFVWLFRIHYADFCKKLPTVIILVTQWMTCEYSSSCQGRIIWDVKLNNDLAYLCTPSICYYAYHVYITRLYCVSFCLSLCEALCRHVKNLSKITRTVAFAIRKSDSDPIAETSGELFMIVLIRDIGNWSDPISQLSVTFSADILKILITVFQISQHKRKLRFGA